MANIQENSSVQLSYFATSTDIINNMINELYKYWAYNTM